MFSQQKAALAPQDHRTSQMAETGPTAEQAQRVALDVFEPYGWEIVGPVNQNWPCVNQESHKPKGGTHPTDLVLKYQDPVQDCHIYVNFDVKSFGKTSITKQSLRIALESLSKATVCANVSSGWAELYCQDSQNRKIVSALFIYNHDGEFTGDFHSFMESVPFDRVPLAHDYRLYVFSPQRITNLYAIAKDLQTTFLGNSYHFYYPDAIFTRARNRWLPIASIESLFSPWIIAQGEINGSEIILFYDMGSGESYEDMQYILDFLFRWQLVGDKKILLRMPNAKGSASINLEKAKEEYAEEFHGLEEFKSRLNLIFYDSIQTAYPNYSIGEIGMEIR